MTLAQIKIIIKEELKKLKEEDLQDKVEVIEIDQWSSTGDFENIPFDELKLDKIHGGDADAAKQIFGGSFRRKLVDKNDSPYIGSVWLAKNKEGFPFVWKANYDSSG